MSAPEPTVVIRELSAPDDLERLVSVFDDIWHPDPANRPVSADLLRALAHAGNYVAGAYLDDELVGGSVGFFATPLGETLHSHMTGVSRSGDGHRLGLLLKLHQRDWARERGLRTIIWTFDPLVARNAYFNITKLGATPIEYHEHFYGHTGDELAGDDESDRVVMAWPLDREPPAAGTSPPGLGQVSAIDLSDPAHPQVLIAEPAPTDAVAVSVPPDITLLRRTDPAAAARWRLAVRETLAPLTGRGRPVWFRRSGEYIFGPEGAA